MVKPALAEPRFPVVSRVGSSHHTCSDVIGTRIYSWRMRHPLSDERPEVIWLKETNGAPTRTERVIRVNTGSPTGASLWRRSFHSSAPMWHENLSHPSGWVH